MAAPEAAQTMKKCMRPRAARKQRARLCQKRRPKCSEKLEKRKISSNKRNPNDNKCIFYCDSAWYTRNIEAKHKESNICGAPDAAKQERTF